MKLSINMKSVIAFGFYGKTSAKFICHHLKNAVHVTIPIIHHKLKIFRMGLRNQWGRAGCDIRMLNLKIPLRAYEIRNAVLPG